MPRYVFSCQTCGDTFEKDLPLHGDRSHVQCPSGHHRVRRVYSAAPVLFKGGGWYSTDHRPADPGAASGREA